MIRTYRQNSIVWLDMESPTPLEVKQVLDDYSIHPLVGEELLTPTLRPKVDLYRNCIYLILHFPVFEKTSVAGTAEIDFIVGRNFIITNRFGSRDTLLRFTKIFEMKGLLGDKFSEGSHAGFVFSAMLKDLYSGILDRLEVIRNRLTDIESKIFSGREREMVQALSDISRTLLDSAHALSLHRQVLESFETAGRKFFGDDFVFYLQSLTSEYYKIEGALESARGSLVELRETNNSLLSTKQNEIMKSLTVVSFIALPLGVIAALFQIEAVSRPIVGQQNDFWIIVGLMAAAALGSYIYFKIYKKWL
ncbi:MAG: hypothetical protein HYT43_00465 [Candidatus Taylorbacteria bacterium]|nr:hypothetical protein [Candidatus Taylorbacteria bacterium]